MNNYEVVKEIGEGGFGKVCLAKDKRSGRMVAIKTQEVNDASRPVLEREAHLHESLHHPNIVGFVESWEDDEVYFIALEYADLGSLLEYLNKNPKLSLLERLQIFLQICFGLSYLHRLNILHRDLKLENILLVTNKLGQVEVKLADFGAAREACAEAKMTMIGTPCFVSPELLSGDKYGVPNDIWGLGCLFYVCITMKLPFPEKTMYQTIPQGKYEPIPSWVQPDVVEIIKGMLQVDVAKRWTLEQVISAVKTKIAQIDPQVPVATQPKVEPVVTAVQQKQLETQVESGEVGKLKVLAAGLGTAFIGALCKGTGVGKPMMLAGLGLAGWKAHELKAKERKE